MRGKFAAVRLLPFLLLVLFSILSLMLVLSGANVYRGVLQDTGQNHTARSSLSYVANKARQYNTKDGIFVEERDGLSTLVLRETLEGVGYETLIYSYEGEIRESFLREGMEFNPENGMMIAKSSHFALRLEKGLLTIEADNGCQTSLAVLADRKQVVE